MIWTFTTDRGEFSIRPYQDTDETAVLQCWQDTFAKEMPLSLWHWKYTNNPYGHQILLCLDSQNQYAAFYGGVAFKFNWSGKTVRFTQLMDNMSHPSYRGSGVFTPTAQAFFDFFGGPHASVCMYGFPGKLHFDIGASKLRYKALPGGVAYFAGTTDDMQSKRIASQAYIQRLQANDPKLDRLWQTCLSDYPLSLVRDSQYIAWRFGAHPQKLYEIWGYYPSSQAELAAYAVIQIRNHTAVLVDYLGPHIPEWNVDFLACLAAKLGVRGVNRIETWLPQDHFVARAAQTAGMSQLPEPLGFIPTARLFSAPFSFEWTGRHIYYTMADGDLF